MRGHMKWGVWEVIWSEGSWSNHRFQGVGRVWQGRHRWWKVQCRSRGQMRHQGQDQSQAFQQRRGKPDAKMWGTFLNKAPDPLFDPVEVPENDGDVNKEERKSRHQQSKVWVHLISEDQSHPTNNENIKTMSIIEETLKQRKGATHLENLDVSPQNQSRHHSFVPPVRKSQFLQASRQVAGKDIIVWIWITFDQIWQGRAHIFNGIFDESLFPLNSIRITRERVRRVVSGDKYEVFNNEEQ